MRLGFKTLLGKAWDPWYVRRAVDVSIASYALQWFISINGSGMFESLDQMKGLKPGYAKGYLEDVPEGTQLQNLAALDFFAGHFFQFVILPTALIGFAGHAMERHRAARKVITSK